MNEKQLAAIFKPLNPSRVKTLKANGQRYLEGWDVIAHLNRIFGPLNWDKEVQDVQLIFEMEYSNKWTVCYRATVRLDVHDYENYCAKRSEDVATGTAINQPSRGDAHDLAIKTAVTDALKRAAKDLGNQFGLSLYNDGSTESVVSMSLAHPPASEAPPDD
jgi:recombination DNA repair RAD52 pathway protein